jgi:uncharacterized protein with NRDE domain
MCTVTLRCGAGALLLTMNRDELLERAPEEAPRRIPGEPGRPAWLAPFDSASGGTWIGVNERGVASCVLNGYEPSDEALRGNPAVPSRGSIIPRILEGQDGVGPARLPEAVDFSAYPSFTLLVVSKDGGEVLRWRRGTGLTREAVLPGFTFLTSSSWREPDVAQWRSRAFAVWRDAGEPETHGLPNFHVEVAAGDEASAPFMTRTESATRSVTQVRVDASRGVASLTWWPRRGVAAIDPASPAASLEVDLAAPAALIADDGRV